jgi:hypothetical protein
MNNAIAIWIGLTGLLFATYFLWVSRIAGATWLIACGGTLAFAYLVSTRGEQVRELDLKNMKIVQEIRDARTEVFAKAVEVRKLGEEVAELTSYNVRTANRWTDDNHQVQMAKARDQIGAMLKGLGSDTSRINEIIEPINDTILFDLKTDVRQYLQHQIFETNKTRKPDEHLTLDSVKPEIEPHIVDFDRAKLTERTKGLGLHTSDLERLLDRVERFIKTKQL